MHGVEAKQEDHFFLPITDNKSTDNHFNGVIFKATRADTQKIK